MTIDKSLRQHYQSGNEVNPFSKGLETIAGKAVKTAKKAKEAVTSTAKKSALTSNVNLEAIAKSAIKNKIQTAVLGKLGLGFLNPFVGLASLFGFNFEGFAPGRKPGQTQAEYEQARGLRQLEKSKSYMWERMLEGKPYSEKNLIKTINKIAKQKGYVDADDMAMDLTKNYIPEPPEVKSPFAKVVPETPTVITPHGPDETADVTDVTKDFSFENLKTKAQRELSKGPVTTAIAPPSVLSQMAKDAAAAGPTDDDGGFGDEKGRRGGDPGSGTTGSGVAAGTGAKGAAGGATQGGSGSGSGSGKGGRDGPSGRKAYGGLIGKPLPGRNRYL